MAAALKDSFGAGVIDRLMAELGSVHASLDRAAFRRDALRGFEPLGLMARGAHLAEVLARHLPADYPQALALLLRSLGPARPTAPGMASFYYLPHTEFVARFGLHHREPSLAALRMLTQRFTAEFALRPFIECEPDAVFAELGRWAHDPSEAVRRAASEATRPRLPWGRRLRALQADPTPSLPLLEALRDDPSEYVRRSVSNHLNDIGKDHPALLMTIARRWMSDAPAARTALLQHALRSRLKAGDRDALALFGNGTAPQVRVLALHFDPAEPCIGDTLRLRIELLSTARRAQTLHADLRVEFVKADGHRSPKVFRLRRLELAARAAVTLRKSLCLQDLSTRRHHTGQHPLVLQLNGHDLPLGGFNLRA